MRVKALAMAALVVEACSRKKGKANGPSELKMILLGYYIRLELRSQESCIYIGIKRLRHGKQINRNFRIKLFLSQNWGHVFTPKFRRRTRELEASKIVSIKESVA